VSQIAFKSNTVTRMTTTKQYDFLNRLLSVSSAPSAGSALINSYACNNANQRIRSTLADGSYWLYEYDSLGQVRSGRKYWSDQTPVAGQQFEYAHDDIGNRTQTKAGGDQSGAGLRPANYSANNLNQYTSRDVPAAFDVMGLGFATNAVTVNSQAAYRKGEYFRAEVPVSNSSTSVWQSVSVAATNQTTVSGNLYVPKNPEQFYYDFDGNLTNDGRWAYTWDAENRLVSMTNNTSYGPKQGLKFEYDWIGRRIHKQVRSQSSAPTNDVKFVYDGWNLLTELNTTNNAVIRSFMWGTDLSGTIQGAGGVGGLLEVIYKGAQATNCFVAFDGNGNAAALADAGSTNLLAQYEYGPFGEVLRATGPMAKVNPFRFSTKYQDDETELVYYPPGRFYCPSRGGWLSPDPAELEGGLNLYCFVDNDPIDDIDMLGLWKVQRRIQFSRATVTAEVDGESIAELAAKVGLQPGEYRKWLKPVGSADIYNIHCGDKFTIPNEVLLVVGKLGFWPRPKMILDRMAWNGALTMGRKGFKVYYKNRNVQSFTADDVTSYVSDDLWGYAFFGHGKVVIIGPQYGGDFLVTKSKGDGVSAENMKNQFHYGLGIAYLCSAPFGNWRGITSYNGVFWGTTWWMQLLGMNQTEVQEAFQKASEK
jgi:RHS repeat-associated protein